MKVLISFVTTNDPWKEEKSGPAGTVTAALALNPGAIHLLYTDDTEMNFSATEAFLTEKIDKTKIYGHKLALSDVTDYQQLKTVIPAALRDIRKQYCGVNYYLLSGLPQARMIFSLCLNAHVLDGSLLEVPPPCKETPWPDTPDGYSARIKELDLDFFKYFTQLYEDRYKDVRLKINVHTKEVEIDGNPMDLRYRDNKHRSFDIIALLAGKRLQSAEIRASKKLIQKIIYGNSQSSEINIPRLIAGINKQAKERIEPSLPSFDPLIMTDKRGNYWLSDQLEPFHETIKIDRNLPYHLKKYL